MNSREKSERCREERKTKLDKLKSRKRKRKWKNAALHQTFTHAGNVLHNKVISLIKLVYRQFLMKLHITMAMMVRMLEISINLWLIRTSFCKPN